MKKQTFELNNMGLIAMSEFEMKEVDGGSFWSWLGGAIALTGLLISGPLGAAVAVIGIVMMFADPNPNPDDPTVTVSH